MNKKLVSSFVLLLLLLFGLSTTAETVDKEKGYISVNESITKEVQPNIAEISIGVETSDKSLKQASEDNKMIANKINASLKSILGSGDSIKTGNYSVSPQYTYTKENKRVFDKYVVSNVVVIRTKNILLVSKLIDNSISQGVTRIDNLVFLASNYDAECNSALAELTKKAYAKADSVAKALSSQVLGVKSLNATCSPEHSRGPVYAMMAKNAMGSESSTPIESGNLKIFVNVDASFYVK